MPSWIPRRPVKSPRLDVAKYEMEDGKLHLSVYTSAKGFDAAAEDNSFNEYGGEATAATWSPK